MKKNKLSKIILKIAKNNLKEFNKEAEEDFIERQRIIRILDSFF